MAKPDDFDSTLKATYPETDKFTNQAPDLVDAKTKAIKDQMRGYRDALFDLSSTLTRTDWIGVIRIVPLTNNKDAHKSQGYQDASKVHKIKKPGQDYVRSDAQLLKQRMQAHLKVLIKNQGWDPGAIMHTIRVAPRGSGGGQDDNNCGCGCSAANAP